MANFSELDTIVETQQTVSSTALALEDFTGISADNVSESSLLWLVVNSGAVRIYYGGTTPTVTDGIKILAGQDVLLYGANILARFEIIRDGATDAEVAVVLEG